MVSVLGVGIFVSMKVLVSWYAVVVVKLGAGVVAGIDCVVLKDLLSKVVFLSDPGLVWFITNTVFEVIVTDGSVVDIIILFISPVSNSVRLSTLGAVFGVVVVFVVIMFVLFKVVAVV